MWSFDFDREAKSFSHSLKLDTCVHLTTVSKKIAEVVPNTDARTGCKTYSDLKCEHKGFSRKGSVYCTEE